MNNKNFIYLIICFTLIIVGCSKDDNVSQLTQSQQESDLSNAQGGKLIGGVGFIAGTDECDYESQGATYAIRMTGDLKGCLYVFIDDYKCRGDGFYFEKGRELFVGTYKGKSGSFWTNYIFEAKYEGCNEDGSYEGAEIPGLCQHLIVKGSGEGVFDGASGQLHFWDKPEVGRYPYGGLIRF